MKTFELTASHIKLLRRMCVYWEDSAYSGAPSIDLKRPYGNSDVWVDVAEVIGIEKLEDDWGNTVWPKGTVEKCEALHKEMATALQVCLSAGSFEVGLYESNYGYTWKRRKQPNDQ